MLSRYAVQPTPSGGGSGGGGGSSDGSGGSKGGGGSGNSSSNVNLIRCATVTKSTTTAVTNAIAATKKAGLTATVANVPVKTGSELSP